MAGRDRYLSFLAGTVPPAPSRYENDVHAVLTSPDGMRACARVSEHLEYPGYEPRHLEEAHWFELDDHGLVARVEIFWQTPAADPGGFGSAASEESYADETGGVTERT